MGKQKQQVISRFFAPKPKAPTSSSSSQPSPTTSPSTPSPKISASVSFSPSKRIRSSQLATLRASESSSLQNPKKPKLSPHTSDPSPSLHQKFLQKLLEPPPASTAVAAAQSLPLNPKYTPLEQQVVELKAKYPDVLLMVEVGYRYRFFGEDAEIAARVLRIYAHMDHNFLTASVPTFRLHVHVRRLVNVGYKVGVVKQTETAAIKAHGSNRLGPFCRGLSALYTKATLEAAADLGGGVEASGSCSNYLLCVVEKGIVVENKECGVEVGFDVRIGLIAVEISTGDVVHGEFNDNVMRAGLEAVVLSLSPAEVLLGEPLSKQTEKLLLAYAGSMSSVRVERASSNCFDGGGAISEVMSLCESMGEDTLADPGEKEMVGTEKHCLGIEGIMTMPGLAVQALALTIRHLKQFGFENILSMGTSFRPFSSKMEMTLSANTLQQLEILKNNFDGSESGSLVQIMNHTITAFGSRLLRHWVTHPLCDKSMISSRLDAVSEIAESMGSCRTLRNCSGFTDEEESISIAPPEITYLLSSVLTVLGRSPDIQRGITRIIHRTATPSEFFAAIQAILSSGKQLQQLRVEDEDSDTKELQKSVQSPLLRRLILTASSSSIIANAAKLLSSLNKDAADQGDMQNLFIISNGQFPEVASAKTKVQFEREKLDLLIGLYRKQLGMRSLEFLNVSGSTHLIELPLDVKVPSSWVKVNSTKKTIRYHAPEVLTALDRLSLAIEELSIVCKAAWESFLMGFGKYYAEFQAAVRALAALDCLHSLAVLSRNKNFVRPVFVDDDEPVQLHFQLGRHPILETILQDNFVPNNTSLHVDGEHCQIVTGPNMGGKSCYIRQVALIVLMAQVGSYVPASSANLSVLDSIHTRMGAYDSIQRGRSTFLEELTEASHILHNCTSRSLVIIDELGRGTSTHDGVAIAYATLHHLLGQKRCMVLFVTHYPKVLEIMDEFPGCVGAYHVSYLLSEKKKDDTICNSDQCVLELDHCDVTYLYKVATGASDRSFGINVARLAQLPSSCIYRAAVMSAKFETVISSRVGKCRGQKFLPETGRVQNEDEDRDGNESNNCSSLEGTEYTVRLANGYREFFLHLGSALDETDLANSFESLRQAKSLALQMINM